MVIDKFILKALLLILPFSLINIGCENSSSSNPNIDSKLNGTWADGVQSGAQYVYITELKFDNGDFEWTWDKDLQQRGIYDTKNGVLTVTITNLYGQRLIGDKSREYSITRDTLKWGGSKFVKKK